MAALPVVDRTGRCIGILSSSDLVDVTRDMDAGLSELEKTDEPLWAPTWVALASMSVTKACWI